MTEIIVFDPIPKEFVLLRKLKIVSLLLFPLVNIIILSCDSTEGGGGGGTEPTATAPQIVDGFMCAGIFEDKPVGIDNDFWVGDHVYIWLSWVNVTGTHEVKILWIEPGEKLYETKQTYKSQDGKLTTYFWLDTTSSAPAGEWLAEVYLDGNFVRSYSFWLNSAN